MGKLIEEFKAFAIKGNALDLAVGVIIGGAFGKIVSSLVDNIIMPLVGLATGGVDFTNLSCKVNDAEVKWGLFVQNVVDFFIIALCIFIMIKALNKLSIKKEEKPAAPAPPQPSAEEKLLTEIRDLMKEK